MPNETHGTDTPTVEVQDVGQKMLRVYVDRKEYCLPYDSFPEFLQARLPEIFNVHLTEDAKLHWPALGLTVPLASLQEPTEVVHFDKVKGERKQLVIAIALTVMAVIVVIRSLLGYT